MEENRCDVCGLWKMEKEDPCPECGDTMDLTIQGRSLSWECRKCGFCIASTANKLCFWDDGNFPKESYPKLDEGCPYAETAKLFDKK